MQSAPAATPAPTGLAVSTLTIPEQLERARGALREVREIVASDGHAITFQTLAQYRTSLLATIDDYIKEFKHE